MTDIFNQKIELVIDNFVREQDIPTLEIAISNQDNDFFKYKSGLHVNKHEAYKVDGLYLGASISKTITSLAIYHLICTNKMSLHDRVIDILPCLSKCSNIDNNCRIIDLLTHSGGIVEISYNWDRMSDPDISCLESFENNLYKFTVDPNKISKFVYGNIGYDILGAVIEKISKKYFHTFINEHLFDKLNINNTFYLFKNIPQEKLLSPYIKTKMELLPICGFPPRN